MENFAFDAWWYNYQNPTKTSGLVQELTENDLRK
jgi:hypothetical protein